MKGQPATFQFLRYSLRSFHFDVTDQSPSEATVSRRYDVVLQRRLFSPRLVPRETQGAPSLLAVAVELSVSLQWVHEPGPFEFKGVVRGEFSYPEDMLEVDSARLCRYHAPALLYAQLRPLVRMHAAESGAAGFMLPLLNVSKTLEMHDAAEEQQGEA